MRVLYRALLVFLLGIASTKFRASAYKLQRMNSHHSPSTVQSGQSGQSRYTPHQYRATGHALHQSTVDEQPGIFRRKNLPIFGAAVGLTALFFQIFILYPWHELLRDDFSALEVFIVCRLALSCLT